MPYAYMTFLGTSPYLECRYKADDFTSDVVRFVQEATIQMHCSDWNKEDCIVIFATEDARKKNWRDNGHKDEKPGLKSRLKAFDLSVPIVCVPIPDGHDESQIWEIFNRIYDHLPADGRVVFDITHAFRSIPMLAIVILNYAKVLKNIRLEAIWYGAFEKLGRPADVRRNIPDPDRRIAPLLDLATFDQLLDWTSAVQQFVSAGDAKGISTLASTAIAPILKDSKGKDEAAQSVRGLAIALNGFSKTLSTCRGRKIGESVDFLKEQLERNRAVQLIKPLHPLLDLVRSDLSCFGKEDVSNGIQAAKWCVDHNLVQQGVTILFETWITFLLGCAGELAPLQASKEERRIASDAAAMAIRKKSAEDRREALLMKNVLSVCEKHPEMAVVVARLRTLRNDINHAGHREQYLSAEKFETKLRAIIEDTEKIYQNSE